MAVINLLNFNTVPRYSFLQYITSGCELNFMVAIDFTGSNGIPSSPTSLHYISPIGKLNQYCDISFRYEVAISGIGSVLEYYDTDKKFPSYLFGGRVNGQVEHCYPLNGNYSDPEVNGVSGKSDNEK